MTMSESAKQGMDKTAITTILEKEYPCINVTQDHMEVLFPHNSENTGEGDILIDSYKQALQQLTSITVNMIAQQKEKIRYLCNEIEQLKETGKRIDLKMEDRVNLLENQFSQMIETKTKEIIMDTMAEKLKKAE